MPLLFYFLAVLPAAWIGGLAAGLVAALMSVAASIAFFIGPRLVNDSPAEWVRIAVFILEASAISLVIDQLQRRTRALREAVRELDGQRRLAEQIALEDSMTGLGNRRAFIKDLVAELAGSARTGAPLTLVIADIDGLKQRNDELGHEAGDALIQAAAAAIARTRRAADRAYRIGGDEFAIVMPNTDRREFAEAEARLQVEFDHVDGDLAGSGASIGAAHAPEDGIDVRDLCSRADARMYAAKAARRRASART
jgi:diguanylate cyclase (GGDEF)-like protein